MQLILITGLSGSGKSVALNVLEDSGFYCVDNLPVKLVPELVELLRDTGYNRVALAVDARSGGGFVDLPQYLDAFRGDGIDLRALFLEANTNTLVQRFSETRRRHPLSDSRLTLPECIEYERELLSEIGTVAHHIDTSELAPSTLRAWIKDFVDVERASPTLLFQSFGFKHGIPLDADLVFDVRCLPNPHYDPELRPLTGTDRAVIEFLERDANVRRMHADIRQFVENWLPCFTRDNRSYLTVAIGCTGGRHRSVYFVEQLARHFRGETQVLVRHRELASEP